MASRRYPQFLLLGDSIVQYSSFLRDGFSFGAVLEEREWASLSLPGFISYPLSFSCTPEVSADLVDCQRRVDVVNRGLVSGQVTIHRSYHI